MGAGAPATEADLLVHFNRFVSPAGDHANRAEAPLARPLLVRTRRLLSQLRLPPRPTLLLLTFLLVTIIGIILTGPSHRSGRVRPGFVLPEDFASSKLDNTSAKAPDPLAGPGLSEIDHARHAFAHSARQPGPGKIPAAETESRLQDRLLPGRSERGDTPMLRTWNKIHYHALLAALLAASPALGQQKSTDLREDRLDSIKLQLDQVERSVRTANTKLDALQQLRKDFDDLKAGSDAAQAATQRDLISLSQAVTRLQKEVEGLRNAASSATRIAGSPPNETRQPTGVVELVNTYSSDVAVVVNSRTYRLHPGDRRFTDPLPAGTFTYEVLGVTPPNTRPLNPNEVYHITVHPQL
jgi:hypothetical protein